MILIRLACAVYLVILTVLLWVPEPAALLGLTRGVVPSSDRGVHFVWFLGLAILVHASRLPWRRSILLTVFVLYALVTEGLQSFVPTRTVELLDAVENLLGLAVGTILWQMLHRGSPTARRASRVEGPEDETAIVSSPDSTAGNS